jgi:hypothetical protein
VLAPSAVTAYSVVKRRSQVGARRCVLCTLEGQPLSRLLSLFLVLVYVTGTGVMAGTLSALKILAAMLLPLACIWFPEVMGDYTQGHVNRRSPPSFVWFLGWILLLLPMIVGAVLWLQGVRLDGSLD